MASVGLHLDNYRFLDPYGLFNTKNPENYPVENDLATHRRIVSKLEGGVDHVKLLWFEYDDNPWDDDWRFTYRERIKTYIITARPKTITIRAMLRDPDVSDPILHASRIMRAVKLVESLRCEGVAIWVEIGNEPNHPSEKWAGSSSIFNQWFMLVVSALRAQGFDHGIFYPGLTPSMPGYLDWYSKLETRDALRQANGIALHLYDPMLMTYYDTLDRLNSVGLGYYPMILSEVGTLAPDRISQYLEVAALGLPYHIFIVDGKSGGAWDQRHVLSVEECNELRNS